MFVIKNLTKKFKDRILFENINLILPDTGLFIIKGRSGEGKTTLLNILSLLEYEYQVILLHKYYQLIPFLFYHKLILYH